MLKSRFGKTNLNVKGRMLPIFLRRSSENTSSSQHPDLPIPFPRPNIPEIPSGEPDRKHSATSIAQEDCSSTAEEKQLVPIIDPSLNQQSSTTIAPTTRDRLHSTSPVTAVECLESELKQLDKLIVVLEKATPDEDDGPVGISILGPNEPHVELQYIKEPRLNKRSTAFADSTSPESHALNCSAGQSTQNQATIMSAPNVLHKRVWVKRQGASATLVQIGEDDLVDDVREKILRKYANSLGKTFDSPDVTLRITPRADSHGQHERSLGPEELVATTLNQYYPAGQTVEEALIIDIPHRRTPRHSPRVYVDHHRPSENGGDYFSVMPVAINHSPHLTSNASVPAGVQPPMHAISVLNTGQLPIVPLPSPGAISRRHGTHRPKYGRTATSSPTVLTTNAPYTNQHTLTDRVPGTPGIPTLATPPIPAGSASTKAVTPPARAVSPKPTKNMRLKKPKKPSGPNSQPTSLLDGGVPPISVLIVEDNIINLKLLEAFMKRLKVRWQTAMNGRDAVVKWRTGGFHLVLMDIQLPIMSGLEATREIRRLESVNGIGVLSAKVGDTVGSSDSSGKVEGNDQLQNIDQFKSPVIIVALTASSLQSDRHEALAAGCNDFLTKPVNFVWLERKVMEWGCMQALIDFDGWRKWKEFAQSNPVDSKTSKLTAAASSRKSGTVSASEAVRRTDKNLKDPNSDSTDTTDTPPPTTSSRVPPDTLVALRNKTQSDDTIESMDSMASNDSIDTIHLNSPRPAPLVPSLSTMSSSSSNSTVTNAPTRSSLSRQSSSQTTRTNFNREAYPTSPNRVAINGSTVSPSTGSFEDGRRRKRSSLGVRGLNGVAEELEGLGST